MKYIFLSKYSLSGIIVLIIRLANKLYIGNNREAFVTLELLRRMVTFNKVTALLHFHFYPGYEVGIALVFVHHEVVYGFSAFESILLWPFSKFEWRLCIRIFTSLTRFCNLISGRMFLLTEYQPLLLCSRILCEWEDGKWCEVKYLHFYFFLTCSLPEYLNRDFFVPGWLI